MPLLSDALLARVRVPRTSSTRDITALETAMQGLTLDDRHPVALEIAGTATDRAWLLRATTPTTLRHAVAQIQARYPQAEIEAPVEDPLMLQKGEVAVVEELCPGAASYLPLRTLAERELLKEGADPLLGLLAAFDQLPPQMRAVAQMVLLPLPASWSRAYRRRAVEHPLGQERVRQRVSMQQGGSAAPNPLKLVGLIVLVVVLLIWWRFQPFILAHTPAWLTHAATQLVHGKMPHLTSGEIAQLFGLGLGLLMLLFSLAFFFLLARARLGQPAIYNMRLVDEKTGRLAYRVCLRLIVISAPDPDASSLAEKDTTTRSKPTLMSSLRRLHTWLQRSPDALWLTGKTALHQHWQTQQAERIRREPCQEVLDRLAAAYRQYHTASGGYFLVQPFSTRRATRLLTPVRKGAAAWAADVAHSRHLLSVADIATLWHLPQAQDLADLNYVPRGRARTFLVPAELTRGQGYHLGASSHAGQIAQVFLPPSCLRQNLLAVASTGKGKSTLFHHLACAAMQDPERCVVVIEPHGDLVSRLLGTVPPSRQDDIVIIDLATTHFPVGINPLDMSLGRSRDKAVDNLIQIGEAQWRDSWGPRTENVFEMATKTLAEANEYLIHSDPQGGAARQYTVLDIVPLLEHTSFRHSVLEQIHDPVLLNWWAFYYESKERRMQEEITSSVITKLTKFASSQVTRNILGQSQTTVNVQEIIRQGKILLISTASGVVGADISALVGATLLGLFQTTLAEQAHHVPDQRRSILALIDEFQVFGGVNYQTMLAELRKYGGSFGLATQSLAYLDSFDRTLRSSVLANIDHLFAFAMAAEDAHALRLYGVEEADITQLDDYQCYARLSLAGQRLPLFSLNLNEPPHANAEQARALRLLSQQRDARPVGAVEAMLRDALVRHKHAAPSKDFVWGDLSGAGAVSGGITATGNTGTTASTGEANNTDAAKKRKNRKKRGNGGKPATPSSQSPEASVSAPPATSQMHLMYEEEERDEHN